MTRNVKRSRSKPPVSVVNVVAFDKDARRLPLRGKRRPPNDVHEKVLVMDIVSGGANALAKGALLFLSALMVYTAVPVNNYSNEKVSLSSKAVKLHIPSGLDEGRRRELSLSLGGGDCLWQPPIQEVPTTIDFYKTAVVGFPSGDKRMTFMQMEALTGWPAKDEWDFEYLGDSNHPFIKANYPHHEGIWGWGTNADQVVMVVKNIRKSLVEYHDILWDIGYAKTYEEATLNLEKLYTERPPLDDFLEWRDLRVFDEIYWYGWFIDYWMEGGLMRDIFTHNITTVEHFNMLMLPYNYDREELDYNRVVGPDTIVDPSYDPHCANGDISGGCEPVAVISAEKLLDLSEGPNETAAIASALMLSPKMSPYVIDSDAWRCIWEELIVRGKGAKTVVDRPDSPYTAHDYDFSAEMLQAMRVELDRLIAKYTSSDWNTLATADRLVELLTWHRDLIQEEEDDLNSGRRKLTSKDFLGPREREKMRLARHAVSSDGDSSNKAKEKSHLKYFDARARERMAQKRRKARKAQRLNARRAEKKVTPM
eukprot:scaffold2242_cov57-Cyclotella_meneghiniana.AAC.3